MVAPSLLPKIHSLAAHLPQRLLSYSSHPPGLQDSSLQCPSNVIWPFNVYLSHNNPSKRNPKLKMKTSLEVLNIICPSQEPTSVGHRHYKQWGSMVDSYFCTLYWKHVPCNSCTSFVWVLYIISTFLDCSWEQLFHWRGEIWEPFKMKLIWGLQSWTLLTSTLSFVRPDLLGPLSTMDHEAGRTMEDDGLAFMVQFP